MFLNKRKCIAMQMHICVLRLILRKKSEIIAEDDLGLFENQGEERLRVHFEAVETSGSTKRRGVT